MPSASATPWDGVDESSLTPAQRLVMGWQREQYDWLHRLGGELDLFSVMMNPPEDRLEKAALVLGRATASPKTLRYRDYYRKKPSKKASSS